MSRYNSFFREDDLQTEKMEVWMDSLSHEELKEVLMEVTAVYHNKVFANRKLSNALYGSGSEQLVFNLDDPLSEEPVKEVEVLESPMDAEILVESCIRHRNSHSSKINISALPVQNKDIYPDDPDFIDHPELYREVGVELSREVVYPCEKPYIRQQTLHKFCREDENGETIFVCAKPEKEKLIASSYLSPELAARIVSDKVILDLPLYRQEQEFKRRGFSVSRQTLSNWSVSVSEQYLEPLYNRIHEDLKSQELIHIDETPLRVINKANGSDTKLGNITVACTTAENPVQIAYYQYSDTKDKMTFTQLLPADYTGVIICDAAPAHSVFEKATLQYCMAHARREFESAVKTRTDYQKFAKLASKDAKIRYLEDVNNPGLRLLLEIMLLFGQLYVTESTSSKNHETAEQRLDRRQRESVPVFNLLKERIICAKEGFPPKSPARKAAEYFLKYEAKLRAYLSNGAIPIDNNSAERTVKPFVMGRKNFLFSNTSRGARTTAICFTIMESAKRNGLRPDAYLSYVLDQLRTKGLKEEVVRAVLPYSTKLPQSLYVNKNQNREEKD